MVHSPLNDLIKFGQSFWLDNIRRGFTRSGELRRLVDDDGLRGVTSNPTIFEKAIARERRLRRRRQARSSPRSKTPADDLRRAHDRRRPRGVRRLPRSLRRDEGRRRLRVDRTAAELRERYGRLDRRGFASLVARRPARTSWSKCRRRMRASRSSGGSSRKGSTSTSRSCSAQQYYEGHRRVLVAVSRTAWRRACRLQQSRRSRRVSSAASTPRADKRIDSGDGQARTQRRTSTAERTARHDRDRELQATLHGVPATRIESDRVGRSWPPPARAGSVRSGRARRRRIRSIPTRTTSRRSSARIRSTRCRRPRSTPSAITARSRATLDTGMDEADAAIARARIARHLAHGRHGQAAGRRPRHVREVVRPAVRRSSRENQDARADAVDRSDCGLRRVRPAWQR